MNPHGCISESTGTIQTRGNVSFFDSLDGGLKAELEAYLKNCAEMVYTPRSFQLARIHLASTLLFFADRVRDSVKEILYEDVIAYYEQDFACDAEGRAVKLGHARRFFRFMSEEGYCTPGYALYLNDSNAPYVGRFRQFSAKAQERIMSCAESSRDFPALEMYDLIPDFTDCLKELGYSYTTIKMAHHALRVMFLFLEINGFGYHTEIVRTWFEEMQPFLSKDWKSWRRVLYLFDQYTKDGGIAEPEKRVYYNSVAIDALPGWCTDEIDDFKIYLQRNFCRAETIRTYQYPCIRFCRFIVKHGCETFDDVTSEIVREYCRTDRHRTFKGKSSSLTVVRRFIMYLEECGSIRHLYLHLSIEAGSAPQEKIVDVLNEEQTAAIDAYRREQRDPMSLRSCAITLVGLKMGFRACDVINLKFSNIDWKNRSITIIQKKTGSSLQLPMPTEVGNALYLYLRYGRPRTDSEYVFVRHKAPYGKLTNKICTNSLFRIIPERKEVERGGFHVTRRTFATSLLKNGAGIQSVMDGLGHTDPTSVMKYLAMDEERMRFCPISLADLGISWEETGSHEK